KAVYKDSEGKPEVATKVMYDLINKDKVSIVIGGVSSSVSLAIAPIADNEKVILLSPASSSPKLSGIGQYFFRIYPSDKLEGYTMANSILKYQKKGADEYFKNVVVVSALTDYAEGIRVEFINEFRRRGGDTDAVITYDPANPEFDKVIDRVKTALKKRDYAGAIFVAGYYTDIADFLIALKKASFFDPQVIKVFATSSVYTPKFESRAASYFVTTTEGKYGLVFPVICHITPNSPDEAIAVFAKNYHAKFGAYPESYAAHGFDAVKLIATVVERRGIQPQDVQFGLSIMKDWPGVSGRVTFDDKHDVSKYPVLYGYDGKEMLRFDPEYKRDKKTYYEVVDWK
ncbi:MAG: ABC transporter substrate-binding protein, partial [Acidobacteria bacterium]|nr:ABC transporter substrate-binding protein [Acidobacteriota bacterium]